MKYILRLFLIATFVCFGCLLLEVPLETSGIKWLEHFFGIVLIMFASDILRF